MSERLTKEETLLFLQENTFVDKNVRDFCQKRESEQRDQGTHKKEAQKE